MWGLISPKESSVAVDDLESLGEVSALPITKCIKMQCPASSSAVFLKSVNSCFHLLSISFFPVPFPKALYQVLKTGEDGDTISFFRFTFWRKTVYWYSIKQSTDLFLPLFLFPRKVFLRGWDKIFFRTKCGDRRGAVFVHVHSLCAHNWIQEQSSPDGKPFKVITVSALNHCRGCSSLGDSLSLQNRK